MINEQVRIDWLVAKNPDIEERERRLDATGVSEWTRDISGLEYHEADFRCPATVRMEEAMDNKTPLDCYEYGLYLPDPDDARLDPEHPCHDWVGGDR